MPRGKISAGVAQPDDLNTAACVKLLSAVIALAVDDCCKPQIGRKRNGTGGRLTHLSKEAFRFIFIDPYGMCRKYLEFLDIEPDTFRSQLVSTMRSEIGNRHIADKKRMWFRRNYSLFLRDQIGESND